MNIELSEQRIKDMFSTGEACKWAKNVYHKVELSEDEKAFSEVVNDMVNEAWKFNKTDAKESIAQLVGKIIEPEIFESPNEILEQIFDDKGSVGEFDMVKVRNSPKNTLVARQSARRTGNVDKSYIDVTIGEVLETHLQIETELKMSDLRRDGAFGVAELTMFAIEEFNRTMFKIILDFADKLIVDGGKNYQGVTGAITENAVNALTGYVYDNCFEGTPEVVGLSNNIREMCKAKGDKFMSNTMKDELNNINVLQVLDGVKLVPIKAGKKTGDGQTLLPEKKIFGFCGKIGSMYKKGEMRSMSTDNNNDETISLKFTGVEFGVCVTKPEKMFKLEIK